jgi:hypothetical protein
MDLYIQLIIKTMKINWFINLNQSLDLNPSNLFFGNQIIKYIKKNY